MTRQRSAIVLTATFVLGTWLGVALVQAHDVRLDEAMAALQKAAALVEAARTDADTTTDPVSSQTQHAFDRHRAKALAASRTRWSTSLLRRQWRIPMVPNKDRGRP
jgi:hypothetical protein